MKIIESNESEEITVGIELYPLITVPVPAHVEFYMYLEILSKY